jgi:hypothetical protein
MIPPSSGGAPYDLTLARVNAALQKPGISG